MYTFIHVLQSTLHDYIGIWSLRESDFNWKDYRTYVKNNSILSPLFSHLRVVMKDKLSFLKPIKRYWQEMSYKLPLLQMICAVFYRGFWLADSRR